MLFDPVFDKPEAPIEPPGSLVVADHGQLQQLDLLAGKVDHCLDQPATDAGLSGSGTNIHAPEQPLMRLLGPPADDEAGYSHQISAIKCAKHRGTVEPFRKAG